jgi:hypothetical protein
VFETRVLRKIFGRKRDEVIGGWRKLYNKEVRESCILRSFITCIARQVKLESSSQGGWDWRGMWHNWGGREMHIGFWWELRNERDH